MIYFFAFALRIERCRFIFGINEEKAIYNTSIYNLSWIGDLSGMVVAERP